LPEVVGCHAHGTRWREYDEVDLILEVGDVHNESAGYQKAHRMQEKGNRRPWRLLQTARGSAGQNVDRICSMLDGVRDRGIVRYAPVNEKSPVPFDGREDTRDRGAGEHGIHRVSS
jgi:hypothetical protein